MFLADSAGASQGEQQLHKGNKEESSVLLSLRQRGSAEGAQGLAVKVDKVFLYARWRESNRGTCALNGECFKKWNPQGGDFVGVDNEQNEQ